MHITYLFDPLCGWCYGAGQVLERLSRLKGVTVQLAPTGLFAAENGRRMDAAFADFAWQNDQRIARLTGQEFSNAYRERVLGAAGAMFDSAPATLGIVAVGLTEPEREIEALKALQRARYVGGRDICEIAAVADILSETGLEAAAARVRSADDDLRTAYRSRVDAARRQFAEFGARGVPSLVVKSASGSRLLPSGLLLGDPKTLAAELQAA